MDRFGGGAALRPILLGLERGDKRRERDARVRTAGKRRPGTGVERCGRRRRRLRLVAVERGMGTSSLPRSPRPATGQPSSGQSLLLCELAPAVPWPRGSGPYQKKKQKFLGLLVMSNCLTCWY